MHGSVARVIASQSASAIVQHEGVATDQVPVMTEGVPHAMIHLDSEATP
jgi:hypothetical protein